ncbi:MAG: hypothetical protein ACE5E5_13790 [Phycisphaerae bacterium]
MSTKEKPIESQPPEHPAIRSIPPALRERLAPYVSLAQELAGSDLISLAVYGTSADDAVDAKRSAIGNVMVLRQVDLILLQKLASHGAKLGKALIRAPLIMTPEYIESSLDTFPLELIEIHQTRLTVFGEDCFAELTFKDADVRLQCERELKTMLIGLRQGLLAAAGRSKALRAIEAGAADALGRTLRGLLWLNGTRDVHASAPLLDQVEKMFDRKLDAIAAALSGTGSQGFEGFKRLYEDVEALGKVVDGWS